MFTYVNKILRFVFDRCIFKTYKIYVIMIL
nr:MAG TPA: hypothetical protein [Caudoviricetes sp.]